MLSEQTKERLRYELDNIQQTGSVQEYVIKFRQALRKIGDAPDLTKEKKIFTNGLKSEIRSEVRKSAPADIAAVINRAKEIELAIFEENNRNKEINIPEITQQITQQIRKEMELGQTTQQYQNPEIQRQSYQPNRNYQLPDTNNIVTLEDPNFKGRIRYSDGGTLYQDARQLPINQKFYERIVRTEEPDVLHKLSARIAELEREKVRNRKQTITCYNCGKTGHTKRECKQQRQNITAACNYCKRTGHNENDCWTKQNRTRYNNNNVQGRYNNQNHNTREINYVGYEDRNYVDYENYGDDQEVYITTRSGNKYVTKNPTPRIIT